ncbi:MAG: hypothetical protein RXR20_16715 [Paraburkholderia sp.]|jgi:hypothetical protein|uniref:hypothetical protein n=1 Tax=Burkholderiaceae TaxID=119060 RepID=UPI0010F7870A|nr:hypothetical protein [Burkholderia sp. 4M9327F10]
MLFLKRLLILLSLALFTAQGAFAHEHAGRMVSMTMSSAADGQSTTSSTEAHCEDASASGQPCGGAHLLCCCAAACGIHCAALFAAFQFEPHGSGPALPQLLSEVRREGLTHAPPVRPPIA